MSAPAAKNKRNQRNRTQRYTSNVFSMFNEAQIQEFKEAFTMIDQNKDGFIDREDLVEMLTSLGRSPKEEELKEMLSQAPGDINFTMFLTLFGEKMSGSDPDDVILNAFSCFDKEGTGKMSEDLLRELLTTMGDRWKDEQVDDLFHDAPINKGMFDYVEFTKMIKHGKKSDQ